MTLGIVDGGDGGDDVNDDNDDDDDDDGIDLSIIDESALIDEYF